MYACLGRRAAETEIGIVRERHDALLHPVADLDGQATRRPAGQIADGGIELRARGLHQRLFRRGQYRAHQRNAEGFDAEFGVRLDFAPGPRQAINPKLGFLRDLPYALGHALRVEAYAELEFLAAADVLDFGAAGQFIFGGNAKARAHRRACHVFHAHRLACAEQRAIENGVNRKRPAAISFRAQIEVPRLNAFVPVRRRK